jgi:hypothetical protein
MKILEAIVAVIKALYEASEAAFLERWHHVLNRLRPKHKRKIIETDPRLPWSPSPRVIRIFRVSLSTVSFLVIATASWSLWRHATRHDLEHYRPMFTALGRHAASQTRAVTGYRDRVVVIMPDVQGKNARFIRDQLKAFRNTLQEGGLVSLAGVWNLSPDTGGDHGLTSDLLHRVLAEYNDAAAIVSFVGAPRFTQAHRAGWTPGKPHLIVVDFDPDTVSLRGLLASNIVAAVIIPKSAKQEDPLTAKSSADEWFNRHFQVVTPDKLGLLPVK